jgi:Transposase DDE domain
LGQKARNRLAFLVYNAQNRPVFVVEKAARGHRYLYLVESVREPGGRVRQRILQPLGRKDLLTATGGLDRLLESIARYSEHSLILSQMATGALACRRIGGPLLFERLWEQTGCRTVIQELLAGRGFEFAVERAIFATVLHRLFVSGSDRACDKWVEDYAVPGTDGLALHHLYRAMAWLGEELDAEDGGQAHATPFTPRCVKDQIEEALFARRRDLFSELSVVFMDTTSLSFEGAGGATLGQRGHSKDHRPDLMQLILCVAIDAAGRPICTEIMPGNTADVRILLPTIDRLRHRFAIGRVCIVADRGMISAATIEGLEQRSLEYILGARERSDRVVREVVLADEGPFTPLLVERANGAETQLFAKEVRHAGRRYIVCRNEAEAEKDRADRQAIIAGLEQQLQRSDKALMWTALSCQPPHPLLTATIPTLARCCRRAGNHPRRQSVRRSEISPPTTTDSHMQSAPAHHLPLLRDVRFHPPLHRRQAADARLGRRNQRWFCAGLLQSVPGTPGLRMVR